MGEPWIDARTTRPRPPLQAIEARGTDLLERARFVGLAVYGSGALLRRSTEDVDAAVYEGHGEAPPPEAKALLASVVSGDAP